MTHFSLDNKMTFGKHKGLLIKEVIENAPSYIEWALDEVSFFNLDDNAMEIYEQAIDKHYEEDNSKYPDPYYPD